MEVKSSEITVEKLIELKDAIDPKPQYQRTSVWSLAKKRLLIDSILRGYDLPKFYVNKGTLFNYEVVDGQQRMRAIWEFVNNEYKLDERVIEGVNTKGLTYDEIKHNAHLFEKFMKFPISLSILISFSQEEIRTLFARLQMGERLNSVELRHATASNIGFSIVALATNHSFFNEKDCKIKNGRYKHQDYIDNALTVCNSHLGKNVRGIDMMNLYLDYANSTMADFGDLITKGSGVLDYMKDINNFQKGIFRNKWSFVDIFYLLYNHLGSFKNINTQTFCNNLWAFELQRRKYNKSAETLIDDKTSVVYDKDLYDYITAFNNGGNLKDNLKIRYRVFYNKFYNSTNFNF